MIVAVSNQKEVVEHSQNQGSQLLLVIFSAKFKVVSLRSHEIIKFAYK